MPQKDIGKGDDDSFLSGDNRECPSSLPLIGDLIIDNGEEKHIYQRPIESSLLEDEARMKKELVGWAKTVVHMAVAHSPPPTDAKQLPTTEDNTN